MKRLALYLSLALMLVFAFPSAVAFADDLDYVVVEDSLSGGEGTIQNSGQGSAQVILDADDASHTFYFELNTWIEPQRAAPSRAQNKPDQGQTYPVTVPFSVFRQEGEDDGVTVGLGLKGSASDCKSLSGYSQPLDVVYDGSGDETTNNVVLCVRVEVPAESDLESALNQFRVKGETKGIQQLGAGSGILIKVIAAATEEKPRFWISNSEWVAQSEWDYIASEGSESTADNFAIGYNKDKITNTNPGQFYAHLLIPNVTAGNLVLRVDLPEDFGLAANQNGVSTKVYVGSENIDLAAPDSKEEYVRNHEQTITVGKVEGEDVYLTMHLKYVRTDIEGLNQSDQRNPYLFYGRADYGNEAVYGDANLSTTIYGVLKK